MADAQYEDLKPGLSTETENVRLETDQFHSQANSPSSRRTRSSGWSASSSKPRAKNRNHPCRKSWTPSPHRRRVRRFATAMAISPWRDGKGKPTRKGSINRLPRELKLRALQLAYEGNEDARILLDRGPQPDGDGHRSKDQAAGLRNHLASIFLPRRSVRRKSKSMFLMNAMPSASRVSEISLPASWKGDCGS